MSRAEAYSNVSLKETVIKFELDEEKRWRWEHRISYYL